MNNKNIIIAPSILTGDFSNLENEIKSLQSAGADYIHLDIMDGVFVPPITFGAKVASDIKKITTLPLDAHLMTMNPQNHIEDFAKAGCSIISVHLEGNTHIHRTLMLIESFNVKRGIALNPHTPVSSIMPIIDYIDHILIMSVNPGYGGQSFIESSYKKIEEAKDIIEKYKPSINLSVDGGVNETTASKVINCGANFLIAGSAIVNSDDRKLAIANLRKH